MTLYDKLKALTAPCREADAEIAEALTGKACIWSRPICGYRFADGGAEVPHYTASLDAAVELVEREMPEAEVGLEGQWLGQPGWIGWINRSQRDPKANGCGKHTLPAVALLLALVDAKGIE